MYYIRSQPKHYDIYDGHKLIFKRVPEHCIDYQTIKDFNLTLKPVE